MAIKNRKHILRTKSKHSKMHRKVVARNAVRNAPVPTNKRRRSAAIQKKSSGGARSYKESANSGVSLNTRKTMPSMASPEEVSNALDLLFQNDMAVSFLKKNISKWSPEVLKMLTTPKTDEAMAEKLGMKINAVRRILNLLHGHGLTNYYVSKNTGGWLSFAWYINVGKIEPFFEYINNMATGKTIVTDECDDYFMCNSCFPKDNVIFNFDSAFESSFRCTCGQKLSRMSRTDVENIIDSSEKETLLGQERTDVL